MKPNVLIVDDIHRNIQVLANILERAGYMVSYALSGQQAIEIVASEDCDLILLDVMMPVLNGYETCQRIRKIPGRAGIPIIFLTARSEQKDINMGFEAGAVDYLTKPCNTAELLARVGAHVQLKRTRDLLEVRNRELQQQNEALEKLNVELQDTLEKVKVLEGILPICSFCKKIRDDQGYWSQVESYITRHSKALFSHSVCPECARDNYPDIFQP
jgi:DNA-binding response OmpR family regulator